MQQRFDGRDLKVLVIEDNEHFRLLIRTVLHTLDIHQIREASDGSEALEMLRDFPADVVILDYKMEPMDGISFALKVRRSAESPNPYVPLIMVTGYSEAGLVREARDAGINEFLAKPLSAKALLTRVVSVTASPRAFVRSPGFVGPDRRRKDQPFAGQERRCDRQQKLGDSTAGEKIPAE
jgi:two-component system chemotaxis response regulator CheY